MTPGLCLSLQCIPALRTTSSPHIASCKTVSHPATLLIFDLSSNVDCNNCEILNIGMCHGSFMSDASSHFLLFVLLYLSHSQLYSCMVHAGFLLAARTPRGSATAASRTSACAVEWPGMQALTVQPTRPSLQRKEAVMLTCRLAPVTSPY